MKVKEMICAISAGKFDDNLKKVYVLDSAVLKQRDRYVELLNTFGELFGFDRDVNIVSAPGRTEVCGNHTDHITVRYLPLQLIWMRLRSLQRMTIISSGLSLRVTE